jgi:hypothetical protein
VLRQISNRWSKPVGPQPVGPTDALKPRCLGSFCRQDVIDETLGLRPCRPVFTRQLEFIHGIQTNTIFEVGRMTWSVHAQKPGSWSLLRNLSHGRDRDKHSGPIGEFSAVSHWLLECSRKSKVTVTRLVRTAKAVQDERMRYLSQHHERMSHRSMPWNVPIHNLCSWWALHELYPWHWCAAPDRSGHNPPELGVHPYISKQSRLFLGPFSRAFIDRGRLLS